MIGRRYRSYSRRHWIPLRWTPPPWKQQRTQCTFNSTGHTHVRPTRTQDLTFSNRVRDWLSNCGDVSHRTVGCTDSAGATRLLVHVYFDRWSNSAIPNNVLTQQPAQQLDLLAAEHPMHSCLCVFATHRANHCGNLGGGHASLVCTLQLLSVGCVDETRCVTSGPQ